MLERRQSKFILCSHHQGHATRKGAQFRNGKNENAEIPVIKADIRRAKAFFTLLFSFEWLPLPLTEQIDVRKMDKKKALATSDQDNYNLLSSIKQRLNKVGLELPNIEVRYKNSNQCHQRHP